MQSSTSKLKLRTYASLAHKTNKRMKKIGITFLTACLGGAVAIGAYKLVENNQNDKLTFEEKQKVYFTNNPATIVS